MRLTLPDISLRVNGVPVENVSMRLGIVDGFPAGATEIAANDPLLGQFTLTQDCVIEIQEGSGPWRPVTLPKLIQFIEEKNVD